MVKIIGVENIFKNYRKVSKLYFIQSPMNASKSALLIMKAYSFEERGIPFVCLKPSVDTRDGDDIIKSRVGISRECICVDKDFNLYEWYVNYRDDLGFDTKWILVDESQFLTREQVNQLASIVDDFDVNVMCYGLRTDFKTNVFEGSKRLLEIADDIDEVKISCGCGRKAIFNARVDEQGNLIEDGEQVLIGGNDKYVSLCRKCYNELLRRIK